MKTKIAVDLPSKEKLLAGLTPRELHPALARAEQAVVEAEQLLGRRRAELAEHERLVAELPKRIHRGEVKTSALTDALRQRDAAAHLIVPAEQALAKARERVPIEEKNAKAALDREVERRQLVLERAAAEFGPALAYIHELATALVAVQSSTGWPCSPEWPCSPACTAATRATATAFAYASAAFAHAGAAK